MRLSARVTALALAAAAVVALPAGPVVAKKKKPKPPATATIKKLLTNAYCQPNKNASGEDVTSVKVTFKPIKVAKARVGSYLTDGTPAGRKTFVFPVHADYFCDYKYTNGIGTLRARDKHITGDYSFFRDEFGKWTQRNHNHNVQSLPGND